MWKKIDDSSIFLKVADFLKNKWKLENDFPAKFKDNIKPKLGKDQQIVVMVTSALLNWKLFINAIMFLLITTIFKLNNSRHLWKFPKKTFASY
jgi:hypothetical protein